MQKKSEELNFLPEGDFGIAVLALGSFVFAADIAENRTFLILMDGSRRLICNFAALQLIECDDKSGNEYYFFCGSEEVAVWVCSPEDAELEFRCAVKAAEGTKAEGVKLSQVACQMIKNQFILYAIVADRDGQLLTAFGNNPSNRFSPTTMQRKVIAVSAAEKIVCYRFDDGSVKIITPKQTLNINGPFKSAECWSRDQVWFLEADGTCKCTQQFEDLSSAKFIIIAKKQALEKFLCVHYDSAIILDSGGSAHLVVSEASRKYMRHLAEIKHKVARALFSATCQEAIIQDELGTHWVVQMQPRADAPAERLVSLHPQLIKETESALRTEVQRTLAARRSLRAPSTDIVRAASNCKHVYLQSKTGTLWKAPQPQQHEYACHTIFAKFSEGEKVKRLFVHSFAAYAVMGSGLVLRIEGRAPRDISAETGIVAPKQIAECKNASFREEGEFAIFIAKDGRAVLVFVAEDKCTQECLPIKNAKCIVAQNTNFLQISAIMPDGRFFCSDEKKRFVEKRLSPAQISHTYVSLFSDCLHFFVVELRGRQRFLHFWRHGTVGNRALVGTAETRLMKRNLGEVCSGPICKASKERCGTIRVATFLNKYYSGITNFKTSRDICGSLANIPLQIDASAQIGRSGQIANVKCCFGVQGTWHALLRNGKIVPL